jgi:hypothetical protein
MGIFATTVSLLYILRHTYFGSCFVSVHLHLVVTVDLCRTRGHVPRLVSLQPTHLDEQHP